MAPSRIISIIMDKSKAILETKGASTKKRQALAELIEYLKKPSTSKNVMRETDRKQVSHALTMLMVNVLDCVESILSGKAKSNSQDINYVNNVLSFCTKIERARLNQETVLKVHAFCVGGLDDVSVRDIGQSELLNILQLLCSKKQYVRCFRTPAISRIVDELAHIVDPEEGEAPYVSNDVQVNAARVFETLVNTCVEESLDMSKHFKECLCTVSHCCKQFIREESSNTVMVVTLLKAASCLIRHHPDQAIAFLQEEDRGAMFKVAKRRYPKASDNIMKESLTDYFSVHL